jgi:hypothetical protein
MRELDFEQDRSQLVAYVVDKILLSEMGDKQAISYIEYLWDTDSDLLADAYEAVRALEELEAYYVG